MYRCNHCKSIFSYKHDNKESKYINDHWETVEIDIECKFCNNMISPDNQKKNIKTIMIEQLTLRFHNMDEEDSENLKCYIRLLDGLDSEDDKIRFLSSYHCADVNYWEIQKGTWAPVSTKDVLYIIYNKIKLPIQANIIYKCGSWNLNIDGISSIFENWKEKWEILFDNIFTDNDDENNSEIEEHEMYDILEV